jgi:hypothetical protein
MSCEFYSKKGDCVIKHRLLVALFASLAISGWSQDSAVVVESYSDGQNSDGFSQVAGKWTESTAKSTAEGVKATKAYFNDANSEAATARFTPNLPAGGKYEVFITYPISGNATDIKYTVKSADGEKTLALTQNGRELSHTPAANQWYSLGVYNFAAGKEGYVELSDPLTGAHPLPNEPNARIYADAVKFVPVDAATPVTAPGETAAASAPSTAPMAPLPGNAVPSDVPPLPSDQAASSTAALPSLAAASAPSPSDLPALPATTPADAAGLPSLPSAGATLPALPDTQVAAGTPALPPLPAGNTTAAALPGLPASTPAPGLPPLPASNAASALPQLPGATTTVATTSTTVVQSAPITNLPSLAPVTPTPLRTLPSPSDTPVPSVASTLPGMYTPAIPTPAPGAGLAVPTPIATGAALPAVTPQITPGGYSVTMYNPSNLQWMYDYGAALNTARAQGKKVFLFFTAEHNKAAQSYETEMFSDPTLRQELSKYILVKVDFPRNTRLAYSLGVFGAGVIAVVDDSGQVTSRVVQKPPTAADLLTQLSTTRPVRATPIPVPQNQQPGSETPAPAAEASGETFTSAPADAAAMPLDAAPAGTPGIAPPPAATPGIATPPPAPPAMTTTATAGVAPGLPGAPAAPAPGPGTAPATPAAPQPPNGTAADALPGLPGA